MYFELQGTFYIDGEKLQFLHNEQQLAYQIEGEDAAFLQQLLPFCTGTYEINQVAALLSKTSTELQETVEQLSGLGILHVYEAPDKQALVVSRNVRSEHIHSLSNQPALQHVCYAGTLEEAKTGLSLLVAVAPDNDREFFTEVARTAVSLQIPWMKISLQDPMIFLGPIFFPDGGPCYTCLQKRIALNDESRSARVVETYGELSALLPGFVSREILKFFKRNTPLQIFGHEIVYNTLSHETTSYQVLSLPTCPTCHPREMFR